MANEKWLKVIDYDAVRDAFDEEYKKTRKLIESGETHLDNLAEGFTEADMVLRKMLNVDAVEAVLCEECKHWLKDVPGCTDFVGRCAWANYMIGAVGYCVYGEKGKERNGDS